MVPLNCLDTNQYPPNVGITKGASPLDFILVNILVVRDFFDSAPFGWRYINAGVGNLAVSIVSLGGKNAGFGLLDGSDEEVDFELILIDDDSKRVGESGSGSVAALIMTIPVGERLSNLIVGRSASKI